MFRRDPPSHQPPPPTEHPRIAAARGLLAQGRSTGSTVAVLGRVAAAVHTAEHEIGRLDTVIGGLDPDRIAGELKAALRARGSVTEPDTPVITALRRRHDALHRVVNQRDAVAADIQRVLADLDTLVAIALTDSDSYEVERQIQTVADEATALAQSHVELAGLDATMPLRTDP